jgi:acetyltransferase
MSPRNLDKVFTPSSVALIGASSRPGSVGTVTQENLRRSNFHGRLYLVNPRHASLNGLPVHPDVASLPEAPDLAIIATPPDQVPALIGQLGARGTKAAVVISAGFAELGEQGLELQQQMLAAAQPHLLRIVGPNCVGVMVPGIGLDASFAHVAPPPGDLAFVSQSGGMITAVLDWAQPRGIGFSHIVSLGDTADVDFGDMLDYLAVDPSIRAILLYIEGITHARKFMSAARNAARAKPVVVVKAGRFAESGRAARSHTGALAGSDAVYDAAFRRAGTLRVDTMAELFDAVETLALTQPQSGDRLAILTNGGGPGVMAADAVIARGGRLATLSPATVSALDGFLPRTWSRGNPVDIIGDAPGRRYADTLAVLMNDEAVDAVLVLNCPTALGSPTGAAQAVIEAVRPATSRNVYTSWLGDYWAAPARRLFAQARIATYDTPDDAVQGFMHRVHHRRNQDLLMQVPPVPEAFAPDADTARNAIDAALAAGRGWLDAEEVANVLDAYGIPAPRARYVSNPEEAAEASVEIGGPIAIKIRSPDITHKTDLGGVILNVEGAARARTEAHAMIERVRAARPDARLDGFLIQEMVQRPGSIELIVGFSVDRVFGPVIMFGQGGTAVELVGDTTLELPPLNIALAHAQIERTRIWRLLQGYRGHPAADIDAIARVLIRVGQLAAAHGEIRELDINPLVADAQGVVALDARITVEGVVGAPGTRLAILPYPKEFESVEALGDDLRITLRPVRPEDAPILEELLTHMTPMEAQLLLFAPRQDLPPMAGARLSQIDYDRQMTLIAQLPGAAQVLGIARFSADPDNRLARFAVALRSDVSEQEIGPQLIARLIEIARVRGVAIMFGDIARPDGDRQAWCRSLGFTASVHPDDPDLIRVRRELGTAGT